MCFDALPALLAPLTKVCMLAAVVAAAVGAAAAGAHAQRRPMSASGDRAAKPVRCLSYAVTCHAVYVAR